MTQEKITKFTKALAAFLLCLSLFAFSACSPAPIQKNDGTPKKLTQEELKSLTDKANQLLADKKSPFAAKLEIFTKLKDGDQWDSDIAKKLRTSMHEEIQILSSLGDKKKAYDLAESIFKVLSDMTNGKILGELCKDLAKKALSEKNYTDANQYSSRALQLFWDEDAMALKLQADIASMEENINKNNLTEAKKYYAEIMDVTSLKGNEALAAKYRASAEKYADKFPKK